MGAEVSAGAAEGGLPGGKNWDLVDTLRQLGEGPRHRHEPSWRVEPRSG